jgi:uncharacterized repeat protein (TIGR03803 family)
VRVRCYCYCARTSSRQTVSNQGGTANAGVVYKWDTASNYTVLHNFTGGADGGYPHAGVICDSAGIAERIVRART